MNQEVLPFDMDHSARVQFDNEEGEERTEADAYLEQFTPDAFCTPQSVVPGHLLDQGHGFLGDPWLERSCPRLVLPKELRPWRCQREPRIFCDKLRLAPGKVDQRPKQERGGVWCGPGHKALVERLNTKAFQPLHGGENPMHCGHSPL